MSIFQYTNCTTEMKTLSPFNGTNVPNYQGYKIYPFLTTHVVKYLNREKRGYKIPRFLSGVQDTTAGTMSSDCFRCTLSNVIKRIRAVGVHCKDVAKPLQRL